MDEDRRPHSRACGAWKHPHGTACSTNCPTCHGKPEPYPSGVDDGSAPTVPAESLPQSPVGTWSLTAPEALPGYEPLNLDNISARLVLRLQGLIGDYGLAGVKGALHLIETEGEGAIGHDSVR
jgi:hypothetical protein